MPSEGDRRVGWSVSENASRVFASGAAPCGLCGLRALAQESNACHHPPGCGVRRPRRGAMKSSHLGLFRARCPASVSDAPTGWCTVTRSSSRPRRYSEKCLKPFGVPGEGGVGRQCEARRGRRRGGTTSEKASALRRRREGRSMRKRAKRARREVADVPSNTRSGAPPRGTRPSRPRRLVGVRE